MIIFNGPTLVPGDVPEGARVMGPARQGDIASVARDFPGETIVLVDGYFRQELSPWHKEILWAMTERGCRVIGAGSLGAIRAAELWMYGMEAVGVIAEWYRDGTVIDDGEVAVMHAAVEHGYEVMTVPLVNVRATVAKLGLPEVVVDVAGEIFYAERTWGALAKRLGQDVADRMREGYVDQKRIDALEAVAASARPADVGCVVRPERVMSAHLVALLGNDVRGGDGRRIYEDVPDGERAEAANEWLVGLLADVVGVRPSEQDVREQANAMWRRVGVKDPQEAAEWMAENGVRDEDWWCRAELEAKVERMRKWLDASAAGFDAVPRAVARRVFYRGLRAGSIMRGR